MKLRVELKDGRKVLAYAEVGANDVAALAAVGGQFAAAIKTMIEAAKEQDRPTETCDGEKGCTTCQDDVNNAVAEWAAKYGLTVGNIVHNHELIESWDWNTIRTAAKDWAALGGEEAIQMFNEGIAELDVMAAEAPDRAKHELLDRLEQHWTEGGIL